MFAIYMALSMGVELQLYKRLWSFGPKSPEDRIQETSTSVKGDRNLQRKEAEKGTTLCPNPWLAPKSRMDGTDSE